MNKKHRSLKVDCFYSRYLWLEMKRIVWDPSPDLHTTKWGTWMKRKCQFKKREAFKENVIYLKQNLFFCIMAVNCTCQAGCVTLNLKHVNSLSFTQALYSTYFSVLLINASNFLTIRKKILYNFLCWRYSGNLIVRSPFG